MRKVAARCFIVVIALSLTFTARALVGPTGSAMALQRATSSRDYKSLRVGRTADVIREHGIPIAVDDDDLLQIGDVVAQGSKKSDGSCDMPFVIITTWSEPGRNKGGRLYKDADCKLILADKHNRASTAGPSCACSVSQAAVIGCFGL